MLYKKEHIVLQGHECLSSCLSNYLYNDGIQVTGNDILITGNAYMVEYDRTKFIIRTNIYEANFYFMDKYSIRYILGKCSNEREAKEFLGKSVKSEERIIIKVSAEYLNYNRVFRQADHSTHYINVIGIRERELFICDGYVPTKVSSVFDGWTDEESVMEAWKSMGFEYVILENVNKVNRDLIISDIRKMLRIGILDYLEGGVKDDKFIGENAIVTLFSDIKTMFEHQDMKGIMIDLNYQLKIFGFISVKIMLGEVLKEMEVNEEILLKYQLVIDHWNRIITLLLKSGFSKKEEKFEKAYHSSMQCISQERDVLSEIMDILG